MKNFKMTALQDPITLGFLIAMNEEIQNDGGNDMVTCAELHTPIKEVLLESGLQGVGDVLGADIKSLFKTGIILSHDPLMNRVRALIIYQGIDFWFEYVMSHYGVANCDRSGVDESQVLAILVGLLHPKGGHESRRRTLELAVVSQT